MAAVTCDATTDGKRCGEPGAKPYTLHVAGQPVVSLMLCWRCAASMLRAAPR